MHDQCEVEIDGRKFSNNINVQETRPLILPEVTLENLKSSKILVTPNLTPSKGSEQPVLPYRPVGKPNSWNMAFVCPRTLLHFNHNPSGYSMEEIPPAQIGMSEEIRYEYSISWTRG
ncbi:hypothetical protein ABEB36_015253 [Hypothenemus hampei]|uniref:Uncharacterized protein n=1 Tax=Hypothenemus hampei TaxID=57062 RepID=A0ABD1E0X2_HYPHA